MQAQIMTGNKNAVWLESSRPGFESDPQPFVFPSLNPHFPFNLHCLHPIKAKKIIFKKSKYKYFQIVM